MTEKLYEKDGSVLVFDATVLACQPTGTGFAVTLDRTAFFPGGGGQACDVGSLGGADVVGAALDGDRVIHFTTAPLSVGSCVTGEVDRSVFDRYLVPLYKQASYKPYIIAAMIFLAKVKDPVKTRIIIYFGKIIYKVKKCLFFIVDPALLAACDKKLLFSAIIRKSSHIRISFAFFVMIPPEV